MKTIRKHLIPAALTALAIISAFAVTTPMAMAEEIEQEQIIAMESIAEEAADGSAEVAVVEEDDTAESVVVETDDTAEAVVVEEDDTAEAVVVEADEAAEAAVVEANEAAAPEAVEEEAAVEPEEDRGAAAVAVEAGVTVGVPCEEDRAVVQEAQKILENEVEKSESTRKYEELTSHLDFTKPLRDEIDVMVDHSDLGKAEKELLKDITKQGIGGLAGAGMLPGIGTMQKAIQAADEFQKAADATTTRATVYHAVIGVEKTADAIITTIPGGGIAVTAKEAVKSGIFYVINKIW